MLNLCIFTFVFYAFCVIIKMIVRPPQFFTIIRKEKNKRKYKQQESL